MDRPSFHPYLKREREHILESYLEDLKGDDPVNSNALSCAETWFFAEALRSFIVGLDDIARQYLVRARLSIDRAFREGVQPNIGVSPGRGFYSDDDELNRHWAIAYKVKYKIELLSRGGGDRDDLIRGMQHIDKLWGYTEGLTDHMAVAKAHILCNYLWLAIAAGDCGKAIQRSSHHVKVQATPRTVLKSFVQEHAYVRFALLVARLADGERDLEPAVRRSFTNLFDIQLDIEHRTQRTCWPGPLFAFEWAWIWECVFGDPPDPMHAIEIIKGYVNLKEWAAEM